MDKELALKKIDEIHSVLMGSNQLLFSAAQMLTTGALVILVVPLAFLTEGFTFGSAFLHQDPMLLKVWRAMVVGFIFFGSRYLPWNREQKTNIHPTLAKMLSIEKPFAVIILLTGVTLVQKGYGEIVVPFLLILLGLTLHFFSLHSIRSLRWGAWALFAGGLVLLWVQSADNKSWIWTVGLLWLGVVYLFMGITSFRKSVEVEA